MKAMLVWSNGNEIYHILFKDKDGKTGHNRAIERMHEDYYAAMGEAMDNEEVSGELDVNCASFSNEKYDDNRLWEVIDLPEEKSNERVVLNAKELTGEILSMLVNEAGIDDHEKTTDLIETRLMEILGAPVQEILDPSSKEMDEEEEEER